MTKTEIRKLFLENSENMFRVLMAIFTDPNAVLSSTEQEALRLVWPTLHAIIISGKDPEEIKAQNTTDILGLLSDGKIDIKEALSLMQVLQLKTEIDDVPKLVEKVELLLDAQQPSAR